MSHIKNIAKWLQYWFINNRGQQCDAISYPYGLHRSGHKMVPMHSAYPQTDGCAGPGHFSDRGRLELLIVDVRLQHFDHSIRDIVLKKTQKLIWLICLNMFPWKFSVLVFEKHHDTKTGKFRSYTKIILMDETNEWKVTSLQHIHVITDAILHKMGLISSLHI